MPRSTRKDSLNLDILSSMYLFPFLLDSTSYSDWLKKKEFTLNEAENQEEEEKGFLKKFVASVKNMLHKLGKRN